MIPKVILESLPEEVRFHGIDAYVQIGVDESSTLAYRRGGTIEIVTRRPKFVPREGAEATPGKVGSPPLEEGCSTRLPIVVQEHDALVVPEDTAFTHNPFVDGALVRYTPELPSTTGEAQAVLIAPVAEAFLPRTMADASLVAHLLVQKLGFHFPYYRQETRFDRFGFPISRSNMARWQSESGELLMPITDALWKQCLERSWFAMDATGTAIRAKGKHARGHVYALVAPGDGVVFRYSATNDGDAVEALFPDYQGTILADAAQIHNGLFGPGKATEAGCWSHCRRPMFQAHKADKKNPLILKALGQIRDLFTIERSLSLLTPAERLEVRQQKSAPLVDAFFTLIAGEYGRLVKSGDDDLDPSPEELFRRAVVYAHNQESVLREFLRNGEIPLSNNLSERALRRIVKGRMNWLFHGSELHAQHAYALISLIATCESLGMDPEFYLQEVLTVASSYPPEAMLDLAPKNWIRTRQRLIAEGRLRYIDLARATGSRLAFR